MKLTLIMPGVGRKPGEGYPRSWMMEPLALAVLASLTPPDIDVRFIDDRFETIPYDEPTDAVAINVEAYTARRAYSIATCFCHRRVPVILGGYHPTLMPEEAIQYADAIVEGQAEGVWPQVIADLRAGTLQRRYRAEKPPCLTGVFPRRELFAGKRYMPVTLIETGRGCRFACDFCSIAGFYRRTVIGRPAANVVAEVANAGHRNVFFVDDNIVAAPSRARTLFDALKSSRVNWISQASITVANDPAMLKTMAQSGCRGVLIGFESLSGATLAAMGKSWNRAVSDYGESIRRIRDAGLTIYATFVFGYDTDDADAFERTLEFAIKQKFLMAAFNHLVPFPGTPLYRRLEAEGRMRYDRWWLDPRYRFGEVPFHPRNMSAEELAQRCYQARTDFYRFNSVLCRAMDLQANCRGLSAAVVYLWLNLFSSGEARKRQSLPLGSGFSDEADGLDLETLVVQEMMA